MRLKARSLVSASTHSSKAPLNRLTQTCGQRIFLKLQYWEEFYVICTMLGMLFAANMGIRYV
jgi:hypothetical protein